ncbi:MAG: cell division protein FtsL [Tepidanaerobacteraceae bacterium]|nr:cell division protein FtsL [Tepidanaerobacteraceae bacterium]
MVVAERDLQRRNFYQEQHEINRRYRRKQQVKDRQNHKATYIVRLVVTALLAFLLLSRFAYITESQYRLHTLQSEINNIESQNERLRVEIASLKSVARIEEIAKNKLNMKEPRNDQIIYLNAN